MCALGKGTNRSLKSLSHPLEMGVQAPVRCCATWERNPAPLEELCVLLTTEIAPSPSAGSAVSVWRSGKQFSPLLFAVIPFILPCSFPEKKIITDQTSYPSSLYTAHSRLRDHKPSSFCCDHWRAFEILWYVWGPAVSRSLEIAALPTWILLSVG